MHQHTQAGGPGGAGEEAALAMGAEEVMQHLLLLQQQQHAHTHPHATPQHHHHQQPPAPIAAAGGFGGSSHGHGLFPALGSGSNATTAELMAGVLGLRLGPGAGGSGGGGLLGAEEGTGAC